MNTETRSSLNKNGPRTINPKGYHKNYIKHAAKQKGIDVCDRTFISTCKNAFSRIYRAVALDIDGTITKPGTADVDQNVIPIVASLLKKGIPVILISGRGRGSAKAAADQIKQISGLSNWYLRRLQVLGYNGSFRYYTKSSRPDAFLENYESLVDLSDRQLESLDLFSTGNQDDIAKYIRELGYIRIRSHPETGSHPKYKHLVELADRLKKMSPSLPWEVSSSTYLGNVYWTISATDKDYALSQVAERLGLPSPTILRIGDSGQTGGNDATLLNCDSGFSVGELSDTPQGCLPVLQINGSQILGVEAAQTLLQQLHIFPPLSLQSGVLSKRIEDLTGFEKLVTARSRSEATTLSQQLSAKHRSQLSTGDRIKAEYYLPAEDIYDLRSGAVSLRSWEVERLYSHFPEMPSILGIPPEFSSSIFPEPLNSWAIFSDTSLLLRGPIYYWSLTVDVMTHRGSDIKRSRTARSFEEFTELHKRLVSSSIAAFSKRNFETYDTLGLKIALAILDQIRNYLLIAIYCDFRRSIENPIPPPPVSLSYKTYSLLTQCTELASRTLLDLDCTWNKTVMLLTSFCDTFVQFVSEQESIHLQKWSNSSDVELFKFRECDHFLQNYSAVQVALRDFLRHNIISEKSPIIGYGLAYGGLELPAIGDVVAKRIGVPFLPRLAKVSLYGSNNMNRDEIYAAGVGYIDLLGKSLEERRYSDCDTDTSQSNCIILDDNCTTCATLQLARDVLVTKGYRVLGCIAVRYPLTNRLIHMGLKAHGFPDPENLLSFVRGLIAPCPYSRLLRERRDSPYIDESGVFDKSKARIGRYLIKHLNIKERDNK